MRAKFPFLPLAFDFELYKPCPYSNSCLTYTKAIEIECFIKRVSKVIYLGATLLWAKIT